MEVKSGPFNKKLTMLMSLLFVILGLVCFAILEAGGSNQSAAFAITACFVWAAGIFSYSLVVDHFTEGVNVEILAVRCVLGSPLFTLHNPGKEMDHNERKRVIAIPKCQFRPETEGGTCTQPATGAHVRRHWVRLPEAEAQDAVQFLMHHPGTSIWKSDEMA